MDPHAVTHGRARIDDHTGKDNAVPSDANFRPNDRIAENWLPAPIDARSLTITPGPSLTVGSILAEMHGDIRATRPTASRKRGRYP